ncbi:aminotransferase family protein [Streptomyces alkaliterrae]|uniref:Aminotransferase class III-fold pyridoxal phosphate-dependent enzyme n=1 Tax=Streptomyces alkaliterrae TaxID=2213162 RepID=A0A5P0YM58_9ACTN|nr:aspartate aminotransferase family protein [Streptomyces alkaliterrae]MBB1253292.1 aspartate aminotransferase family protein [Streptomyces alkaliterrae]MBB1259584.1 aspartate aminotransferase family protein [Streptomyces alkaliterrae]MQS00990.1 aminotransferase class III-fold pyridoxal phosphate-dependent enzyme [Streptomyces alkaliterrae]
MPVSPDRPVAGRWPADLSAYCFEVPHSDSSLLFESAKGVRLRDAGGREFLDGMSGVFVTCFGYDCEPIAQAVSEQVRTLPFNPPLHGTNRPALELAGRLVDLAPAEITTAKLVNGGSEAIEAAIRIARLYHRTHGDPGKVKVLSHYHGYHGSTFGSLSLTGRPDVGRFGPGLPGVVHFWPPDCLESFTGVSYEESGRLAAALAERAIEAEGPDTVAALVVEPVIHLRGMAVPPDDYLRELRAVCDRHNVLLVFDEIVTGFGRTGQAFAAQTFGVTPDLMCVGKGISGGYAPLAAVLTARHVAAILGEDGGPYAFAPSHTYAANPMASAAGLAAVTLFGEQDYPGVVRGLAASLEPRLRSLVGSRGAVRALGLLYGVTLHGDGPGPVGERVARACLDRGLIIRGQDDWIVLAPAFTTTEADLAESLQILGDALDEVLGGGR